MGLLLYVATAVMIWSAVEIGTSLLIWTCGKRATGWALSVRWNDLVGAAVGCSRHRWSPRRDWSPRVWTVAFRRSRADRIWWLPQDADATTAGELARDGASEYESVQDRYRDSTTWFTLVRSVPTPRGGSAGGGDNDDHRQHEQPIELAARVPLMYLECPSCCAACARCFRSQRRHEISFSAESGHSPRPSQRRDGSFLGREPHSVSPPHASLGIGRREPIWWERLLMMLDLRGTSTSATASSSSSSQSHVCCVRAELDPRTRCRGGWLALRWMLYIALPVALFYVAAQSLQENRDRASVAVLWQCLSGSIGAHLTLPLRRTLGLERGRSSAGAAPCADTRSMILAVGWIVALVRVICFL